MRPTALNLAKSVSKRPLRLKRLLPSSYPLSQDMRFLGDSYVKTEFRATRSTDNPIHIIGFLSQWKLYLDQLQQSNLKEGEVFKGRVLQEEYFDKLSDEQAGQLYEFMHASKDLWKSPDQLEASAVEEERAEHESTKQTLLSDPKAPPPPSEMTDPYPLPLSQPSLAEGSDAVKNNLDPMPQPLDRTGEDEATLRARLVYQCRKRGTLETDLILSTFSKQYLKDMTVAQMQEFDKLLDEPDWDIYYWSVGKREVPEKWRDTEILARLKKHAENHGRVVRTMPHLY